LKNKKVFQNKYWISKPYVQICERGVFCVIKIAASSAAMTRTCA